MQYITHSTIFFMLIVPPSEITNYIETPPINDVVLPSINPVTTQSSTPSYEMTRTRTADQRIIVNCKCLVIALISQGLSFPHSPTLLNISSKIAF